MGWLKDLFFMDSFELAMAKSERDTYHKMYNDAQRYLRAECEKNTTLTAELEKKMSDGAAVQGATPYAQNQYRVLERKPDLTSDYQVARKDTYDEAMSAARMYAAKYPGNTYLIMAVVAEIKADVPVVSTELKFKDFTAKKDGE